MNLVATARSLITPMLPGRVRYALRKVLNLRLRGLSSVEYWTQHNVTEHRRFASAAESKNFFNWRNAQYPGYIELLPVSKADGILASLTSGTLSGGVNWPGSAFDPETHMFITHACNACLAPLGLVAPPKDFSDLDYVMGTAGQQFRAIVGGGEGEAADAPRARGATPPAPPAPPAAPAGAGAGAGPRSARGDAGAVAQPGA